MAVVLFRVIGVGGASAVTKLTIGQTDPAATLACNPGGELQALVLTAQANLIRVLLDY